MMKKLQKYLVELRGVEPLSSPYQGVALPLSYSPISPPSIYEYTHVQKHFQSIEMFFND